MMERIIRPRATAPAAAGVLSVAAVSASTIAQVSAAKSSVATTGKQLGVSMGIEFSKFDATVSYDPANVAASTAGVDIDAVGTSVGSKEYNDKLKKKDWFDITKYSKVTFVPSTFKPGAGGKVDMVGKLTIRSITQDITTPITFGQEGASQIFEGAFPVRRNTFKVGDGKWRNTSVVSDNVTIRFRVIIARK